MVRMGAGKEGCVWAVMVLPDGTIGSGESGGRVRLWHGASGTLMAGFQEHGGDVLTLAASPDGRTLFASGVDPRICVFHLVPSEGAPFLLLSLQTAHSGPLSPAAFSSRLLSRLFAVRWT